MFNNVFLYQNLSSWFIFLKSKTQFSSKTSLGRASSPFGFLNWPPVSRISMGKCILVPLIVRGCIGKLLIPCKGIPDLIARANPVPEPATDDCHNPS